MIDSRGTDARQRPRAILFDWDNTLVESWGVIHEALNLTLAAMGHAHWTREETEKRVRFEWSTPPMMRCPIDSVGDDLGLVDRGYGLGMPGHPRFDPGKLWSIDRGQLDGREMHVAPIMNEFAP